MIKINVYVDKNKDIHEVTISGHAGYSKKGEDIVCAGVSALGYTLLNSLHTVAKIDVVPKIDSGYINYVLPKNISQQQFEISQIILKTITIGLKNMYDSYRTYIEYLEEEV